MACHNWPIRELNKLFCLSTTIITKECGGASVALFRKKLWAI